MITSMSPLTTKKKKETTNNDMRAITEECFAAKNFFTKIEYFDAEEDKYMACSVNYSGHVKCQRAISTLQWIKNNKKVCFLEWISTGFKAGLNEMTAAAMDDD